MLDVLFVSPDSSREVYQALADEHAAIEPQPWILLLAGALRKDGYNLGILDPLAERLNDHEAYIRIANAHPKFICFVVYGQNPNSGTTNMTGAARLAKYIRLIDAVTPIIFIGSHPSALPHEVISLPFVDYVCPGDGLNALRQIVQGGKTPGIYWGKQCATDELDYAWDLVDLSRYRCHTWHNNFGPDRSPFASIYTSLGCVFRCDFCMINLVNRESAAQANAAQSTGMRYFKPEYILDQLEKLLALGVRNVRIADEMFFLNRQHYLPILNGIIERGISLNLWAYARVDTARPEYLPLFKRAGFNWICLGIESANQVVRREASKGSFEDVNVRQVAAEIRENGINLLANFMFGLPEDSQESMQETLGLALELNAEHTNFYPCMALPGSPLYGGATKDYAAYSFHSYECEPLATRYCTAREVLDFRDRAWLSVATSPRYLEMIEGKFGKAQADSIRKQSGIKLRRKLLEA